jgi:mono/diheme cytochrome c family protein
MGKSCQPTQHWSAGAGPIRQGAVDDSTLLSRKWLLWWREGFRLALLPLVLLGFAGAARAHPAHAEPVNYPFVVGFERFFSGDDNPDYLAEGGILLLNELNCVGCHAPPEALRDRLTGRPATELAGVGSRLSPVDLELFIRNPRFVKQDTVMPSLFAGPDRDPGEVEALKHFLFSLKSGTAPLTETGDIDAGRRLYHRIGCVACHAPEVGYQPEDLPEGVQIELAGLPSVPMNLADRYDPSELARFLIDPHATRPSGRMPAFKLTDKEAADLVAYLKAGPTPDLPPVLAAQMVADEVFTLDPAKVAAGEKLFASKNCVACHQPVSLGIEARPQLAKPLVELKADPATRQGCLGDRPAGGAVPAYFLDEVQKKAIEAALSRLSQFGTLDLNGRIDWTMTTLNCYACHERGGKGAPETAREAYFAVNDVGALSIGRWGNIPPPLDKVGRKLTDEWFERILFNRGGDGEVRHYMEARMPAFREEVARPLIADLKEADIRDPAMEIDVSGLPKHQRAPFGRDLLGTRGLGCVNCHGLKGQRALGAQVIDLTHTVKRLQPPYFKEVLLDPQGTQTGTMMPPMFTGRPKAGQEIEQIWTYLKEIDQNRLPDGLLRTEDFELKPESAGKPLVFRTFLEGAGTEAVAVGFPEGVHAAFDSRECRWRLAWSGRFLDAMSTWDDRFCAPAKPLGEGVTDLSDVFPGPPVDAEFLGFHLDADGVPTFLYEAGGGHFEDRVKPGDGGLVRMLRTGGEVTSQTLKLK